MMMLRNLEALHQNILEWLNEFYIWKYQILIPFVLGEGVESGIGRATGEFVEEERLKWEVEAVFGEIENWVRMKRNSEEDQELKKQGSKNSRGDNQLSGEDGLTANEEGESETITGVIISDISNGKY
ncbi:hypothetical protein U1Q18_033306 [Sarracenia purpurea var. burkii]